MSSSPVAQSSDAKRSRMDGRRFALGFISLMLLILVVAFGLRAKRIHDWNAAGGGRVVEGVTLPVVHR